MKHFIAINYQKCTGCRVCELACSLNRTGSCNPELAAVRVAWQECNGTYLAAPVVCNQCEEPICERICPTGATARDQITGLVTVNERLCIGCRACVYACPFGASGFDFDRRKAFRCNLCGGSPRCVEFCAFGALECLTDREVSGHAKRVAVANVLAPLLINSAQDRLRLEGR